MTIDKTKLQICIVCNQTIQPKYLGKDKDNQDAYWYEGNNALPIADGRCCDPCNNIVVADRIASVRIAQWEMKQ
jgi:hypothetical protein